MVKQFRIGHGFDVHRFRRGRRDLGDQDLGAGLPQRLRDCGDLVRCFPPAVDHFGETPAEGAVQVHLGEAEVPVRQLPDEFLDRLGAQAARTEPPEQLSKG